MYSNGSGGAKPLRLSPHAIMINSVVGVAGINIGWNQIINTPGQSYVNDVINIFNSSGTAASPINIHNNCINGIWSPSPGTIGGNGTGIITDGGTSPETAYVSITNNTILNCGNCGIGIAAGHDITVSGNTCAGAIPGTSAMVLSANVGIYTWDQMSGGSSSNYYNIVVGVKNTIGWMNNKGVRNDILERLKRWHSLGKIYFAANSISDAEIASLQAAWVASAAANGGNARLQAVAPPPASSTIGKTQLNTLGSYLTALGFSPMATRLQTWASTVTATHIPPASSVQPLHGTT